MSETAILHSAVRPPDAHRWVTLAVVVAAQFMFVTDAFIVNVAIPAIRVDLHATPGEIEAVLALYQIGYAALVVTGGRLGDLFGRRRMLVVGVCGFTLASLWCGLATSGLGLVAARLAQGMTAAMMVPQVLATIHMLFPEPAARARAFSVFGVALGLGGAAGFLLGGALVTLNVGGFGWRSVFFVNLPVGAAIALAAWRVMPENRTQVLARLDLIGAALLFAALVALIGPMLAGHELRWPWWIWLVKMAGLALLGVFLCHARRVERQGGLPVLDLALLRDRRFVRGLSAAAAFQAGNVSFYLLMTLFLQGALRFSAFEAGLAVVPLALAFTLASTLASGRGGMRGLQRGNAIQLAALAAIAAITEALPAPGLAAMMAVLALFGFGQGLVMAPLAGVVLARVDRAHAGSAAGVLNTVQQGAGAAGIALVGAAYFGAGAGRPGVLAGLGLLALTTLATAVLLMWIKALRE